MPDFLTEVVTTHLGQRKVIEPRRPARFEPVATSGVDPMLNLAMDLDDAVNIAEELPDPAEKAIDSVGDAASSQSRSPEQPAPNDHAVPLAPASPKSTLAGDPRTVSPLLEPSFERRPRQASSVPPDASPPPLPDSGTSGSLLPREGDWPEVDMTEATTTQPSIRPTSDRVEPDPLTPLPAYPPPPAIHGSLQPPKLHDLQPHLPSGVGSEDLSLADAVEWVHTPDQTSLTREQQIGPGRDENTQASSSPIRPLGYFDEPTPALIPAAPVRLPAGEALNADRDHWSRRDSSPPTIKVAIGRIEVRAETAPTPPQPAPQVTARPRYQPKLSLTDYLKKRNEGG